MLDGSSYFHLKLILQMKPQSKPQSFCMIICQNKLKNKIDFICTDKIGSINTVSFKKNISSFYFKICVKK